MINGMKKRISANDLCVILVEIFDVCSYHWTEVDNVDDY